MEHLPTKHLHGLDHLRTLAISLVFFFHYRHFAHPDWVDALGNFGWSGVDLFFVLSGYLISAPLLAALHAHEPLPLRRFFIHRATRIIPPFLVTVALYFALPMFRERSAPAPLWKLLTFTQNLGLDLRTQGAFSHAWSLCVEEHFYILLPLALLAARKWPRALLCVPPLLFVCGVCTRWVGSLHAVDTVDWYRRVYYPTYQRLDPLLLGVALSAFVTFRPQFAVQMRARGSWLLALALTVVFGAWLATRDPHTLFASVAGFPLVAAGYALVVAVAIAWPTPRSQLTSLIAKLSYAIYLLHKGVIHLVQTAMGDRAPATLTFFICIAATLVAAWMMRVAVERPALALRARWQSA